MYTVYENNRLFERKNTLKKEEQKIRHTPACKQKINKKIRVPILRGGYSYMSVPKTAFISLGTHFF